MLREENRLLADYFDTFEARYRLKQQELQRLQEDNRTLRKQLERNGVKVPHEDY